ncbi:MAG: phospho-N-acetylmuramoyl-pentapeptide-transferase [Spirochaetes bacterium]|nr:phospho-N-acetylmuramoyl-pentapeptide-transferase [Spirochaetota bacterium]
MLYHFAAKLSDYIFVFNVFRYISFRSVIAFLLSFMICMIFFPLFIKKMTQWKANQAIREYGPKSHNKKIGTPTMGGFLVVASIIITMLICGNFNNLYILIILFATIAFALIGFIDDFLKISKKTPNGMHGKIKLLSQFFISSVVVIAVYYILNKDNADIAYITVPFLKNVKLYLGPFIYIPFCIFIIISSSNAVNLTDGLDGLAGGLLIPVVTTYGFLSYVTGHEPFAKYLLIDFIPLSSELLVFSFALIGGLSGFLWFNSHPAQVFMGDTGSLCFGGLVGVVAIMIKQELLLAISGGIFVAETLSVIIQVVYYKFTKKRIFLMAPLHHHFELKGWSESKIIARFWILGGLLAVIAIGSLKLR